MLLLSLTIGSLYAILAIRDLRLALIVLSGLLPTYLLRFSIGSIPSTALELLILITFTIWFFKKKAWRIHYPSFGPIARPLLLVLAAACFAVVVAQDTLNAFGIWKAYFIEPAIVFVMMRSVFETRTDWTRTLQSLAISSIVLCLFAIFQVATGIGIPIPWDLERRATGIFEYPNALGLFLAPIVSVSIVHAFNTSNIRTRSLWIATATLGVLAIVLAKTEAALVAIPAALLITLWLSHAPRKLKFIVTTAACVAAVAIILTIPAAREKILLQDYSGQVRLSQWYETYELLKDHLLFGVGLNAYPTALAPYHNATLYEIFQYPHNIILNIWVELGILGLLAFFWLTVSVLKIVRAERSHILKLAVFTGLLTMVIHGLVDVPYFKNDLAVLTWILLAALSAPGIEKDPRT